MSEKSASPTKLACVEPLCARKEFYLGKLPVIHGNVGQSSSELYNTFKYFQDESLGYDAWRIKGNVNRMANTLVTHRGKTNAC